MSNFISRWSDKVDNALGAAFNRVTGHQSAAERRSMATQAQQQVQAYKDQSEILKSETDRKRGELQAEKRRVEEKQIRALRGSRRSAGFLGGASLGSGTSDQGTTNKLGA